MAGGLAIFDYDNDGKLDIFFANGDLPSLRKTEPRFWNRLYRNLGGWKSRMSQSRRASPERADGCAAAADFDNDGWTDLFVAGADATCSIEQSRQVRARATPATKMEIAVPG
jgi:hypothetical protein